MMTVRTAAEAADAAEELVPVAARLVGAVRDDGPDVVHTVLAGIPDDRWPALAVVLAAMVDADRSPRSLLEWIEPPSRVPAELHGTPAGYDRHHAYGETACDACARSRSAVRAVARSAA